MKFDLGKTSKNEIVSLFKCIASLLLRVGEHLGTFSIS